MPDAKQVALKPIPTPSRHSSAAGSTSQPPTTQKWALSTLPR
jgi:hypothetical protein